MSECQHEWRLMTENEAYPAASGRVCIKCDKYQLGWFCDINAPGGEETAKAIADALTRNSR
jgi:hypothetical protein